MQRIKQAILSHRRAYGVAGCVAALGIATLYLFIIPGGAKAAPFPFQLILLYGHSLCWLLLGCAAIVFALKGPAKITATLAYSALVVYGIFVATLLAF